MAEQTLPGDLEIKKKLDRLEWFYHQGLFQIGLWGVAVYDSRHDWSCGGCSNLFFERHHKCTHAEKSCIIVKKEILCGNKAALGVSRVLFGLKLEFLIHLAAHPRSHAS